MLWMALSSTNKQISNSELLLIYCRDIFLLCIILYTMILHFQNCNIAAIFSEAHILLYCAVAYPFFVVQFVTPLSVAPRYFVLPHNVSLLFNLSTNARKYTGCLNSLHKLFKSLYGPHTLIIRFSQWQHYF